MEEKESVLNFSGKNYGAVIDFNMGDLNNRYIIGRPAGTFDLGTGEFPFKDLYLNGNKYIYNNLKLAESRFSDNNNSFELTTFGTESSIIPINIIQKSNNSEYSKFTILDEYGQTKIESTKQTFTYDDPYIYSKSRLTYDPRGLMISSRFIGNDTGKDIVIQAENGIYITGSDGESENLRSLNELDFNFFISDKLYTAYDMFSIRCNHAFSIGVTNRYTYTFSGYDIRKAFYPSHNDTFDIGLTDKKWKDIYATNGVIQTSDRNEKNSIVELSQKKSEVLIYGLKPKTYMMNSGNSGRTHWGMISQDIEDLLEELGWTSLDFAGFIKSPKMTEEEIDEKTGKIIKKSEVIEGEYNYSLRYDEFIAPIIKVVQAQHEEIEAMEQRISLLEQQIQDLSKPKSDGGETE